MHQAYGVPYYFGSARAPMTIPGGKTADVNGDGVPDQVYLTGTTRPDSPYIENIQLHVRDGRTGTVYSIPLKNNTGYNPTVFVGDFTGDRVPDILVSIDSGGSGGFTYDEMFSFTDNQAKRLYDNDWFYKTYGESTATYEDHYKVRVVNKPLQTEYVIDISGRDADYLSGLYDSNGKLKQPTSGAVSTVNGVYPIDLQRDGQYELWVFQRIIGLYNADGLGYLQTPLQWNKSQQRFAPLYQWAGIFGSPVGTSAS